MGLPDQALFAGRAVGDAEGDLGGAAAAVRRAVLLRTPALRVPHRHCHVEERGGQRQADAGLIKAANGQLRAVVIEAAHRLARYDPRWSVMATQMREAGKPGSVVAAAVANRWLRWLFHQMQPAALAA